MYKIVLKPNVSLQSTNKLTIIMIIFNFNFQINLILIISHYSSTKLKRSVSKQQNECE